jgi:hypothetical protein
MTITQFEQFYFFKVVFMFFSLKRKEPKVQDCQKKSGNSALHLAKILKLTRTQWYKINSHMVVILSAGSNRKNFYARCTGISTDFF